MEEKKVKLVAKTPIPKEENEEEFKPLTWEEKKVKTIFSELNIEGLNENELQGLGSWYAYFTDKRAKGFYGGSGYVLGHPIVNKVTIKKGLMFFSNVLNNLDEFDKTLVVETLHKKGGIRFKCNNKNGKKLVVDFSFGDMMDFPTMLHLIDETTVKTATILLDKGIIFNKLAYHEYEPCEIGLGESGEYFRSIYEEAYGDDQKSL